MGYNLNNITRGYNTQNIKNVEFDNDIMSSGYPILVNWVIGELITIKKEKTEEDAYFYRQTFLKMLRYCAEKEIDKFQDPNNWSNMGL